VAPPHVHSKRPRRSGIVIGWAFRQVAVCGAVLVLFYAMIGYKLFQQASEPTAPAAATASAAAANHAAQRGGAPNSLLFRANRDGHVYIDAAVNGGNVRFVVDTGATPVALTLKDAMAAGINKQDLVFNKRMSTANGTTMAAGIKLRELRIGQLTVTDVPAVVHENLFMSLLGQSFLTRLDSYEMRDGVLTLNYW
jgi:clan AA aspartic protease (TIGR02281 family)